MNLKIFTENIDPKAENQVYELLKQPAFKNAKVRIMPDVHAGAGCVVGFTADLGDKVIPNIVGVDIGCGMHVVKLGKENEMNINLTELDEFIHNNIPAGFAVNSKVQYSFDLNELYCYNELNKVDRLKLGIGSLGGGNHFIEMDRDDDGYLYLVIHTGSRNLGKQVACIYQEKAINYCRNLGKDEINETIARYKKEGRQTEISAALEAINKKYAEASVPKDLCYLEGDLRERYLHDMRICQEYAVHNRYVIADKIISFLKVKPIERWESIHNYIDDSNMVRKGAIATYKGQKVIIPLNMRDGSIIGIGKGNPDWNESGPHGAGRILSRGAAKKSVDIDEYRKSMEGIFTTTVNESTIDEAPMVYKPSEEIINAIGETVEIISVIKPIYNFKAGDE